MEQRARTETRDQMWQRHNDEWDLVHGGYGNVEELPSDLERRHAQERAIFETVHSAPEAAEQREVTAAPAAPGTANLRTSGPETGREAEQAREMTDARQAESASADTVEITDSKAAKKAALARHRAETEQSIAQAQERGYENSR